VSGTLSRDIADFVRRDLAFDGRTKPVLVTGAAGPAVIVIHEIFGFTPTLARFCRWVCDAGFRVYAPILFGSPDAENREKPSLGRTVGLCISREFTVLASNRSSPVTSWLIALARLAHQECGHNGVGAIGMCLTGGFALSMAIDEAILAPVLAQPGAPALNHAALDIAPDDLARVQRRTREEGLMLRGYRFQGDRICRAERFATLRAAFGPAFLGTELPDSAANPAGMRSLGKPPHCVFTIDLIDKAGEPTRRAVDEVIAFLKARLMG